MTSTRRCSERFCSRRSRATMPPVEGGESCAAAAWGTTTTNATSKRGIRNAERGSAAGSVILPRSDFRLPRSGRLPSHDNAPESLGARVDRVAERALVAAGIHQDRGADEIELAGADAFLRLLGRYRRRDRDPDGALRAAILGGREDLPGRHDLPVHDHGNRISDGMHGPGPAEQDSLGLDRAA